MTPIVSTPKPPQAPDPTQTAAAQTATNVDTAIANAGLGHTNQITPDGSLTYNVTGYTTMKDQNGKSYQLPTYTATQAYSPQNQQIYDTGQQTKLGLANLANDQTQKIGGLLNTNLDLSAKNLDNYTNTHWQNGFNNLWDRNQATLDQSLADKGIQVGSQAYSNAMRDYSTNRQASADQYLGDMYNNAQNAIIQQRNQPINEISALMSGSQVSNPSYVNTPSTQLPTVDQAGLINQNYQNQVGAYNTQLQQSNAAMGGLFGLGSSLLGGWMMSDRRLKTNIQQIGTMANGLKLYSFDYVWGEPSTGFMADEVAEFAPDAVSEGPGGFLMVDYARVA